MAHIRIEMDRGRGWEVRQEGDADVTADDLAARAVSYSISYPHRFFLDGVLIASTARTDCAARRGLPVMTPDELRAARQAAGFASQVAMAEAFDLNRRTVERWERGEVAVPKVVEIALRCMARLRELGIN